MAEQESLEERVRELEQQVEVLVACMCEVADLEIVSHRGAFDSGRPDTTLKGTDAVRRLLVRAELAT